MEEDDYNPAAGCLIGIAGGAVLWTLVIIAYWLIT